MCKENQLLLLRPWGMLQHFLTAVCCCRWWYQLTGSSDLCNMVTVQSHRNNVAGPPRRICVHSIMHRKTIKLHSGGDSDEELPETNPTIWTEIFWFLTLTVTNSGLFRGNHDNYTLLQNLPHLRLHAGEKSAHSRMSRYCGRTRFTWAVNLSDWRWRHPSCELPRLSDH